MLSFKQNFNIKENNRSGGCECILSTAEVELDCGCRIGVSWRWREVLFNGRVSGGNVICYRKLIACCWCPLTVYWLCGYTAEPNTYFTTVTVALNHYFFYFFYSYNPSSHRDIPAAVLFHRHVWLHRLKRCCIDLCSHHRIDHQHKSQPSFRVFT